MNRGPVVGVVGSTGLVGREMVSILEERNFPLKKLRLFASGRSAGTSLPFRGGRTKVENLASADFDGIDIVLASAGADVSRALAEKTMDAGAIMVDNSSAFRMDPGVPLVVPEVNPGAMKGHEPIIANPNCSTIQLVLALKPLHDEFGLGRVVVSTYQAVSGAGKKALDEMTHQCLSLVSQRPVEIDVFPHQIAFNLLPHIGGFDEDGFTVEERKLMLETRKILGLEELRIAATAVRVPVLNSHAEAVFVETERRCDPVHAREVLAAAPGVVVMDEPGDAEYPTPLEAGGRDDVLVGRIRRDPSVEHGLALWICADNVRKGAALNAVQIAEMLVA